MTEPHGNTHSTRDIVVTLVSRQYVIGRVSANTKTQAFIETRSNRAAALARAFELARSKHRVFLTHPQNHTSVLAGRAESGRHAKGFRQ